LGFLYRAQHQKNHGRYSWKTYQSSIFPYISCLLTYILTLTSAEISKAFLGDKKFHISIRNANPDYVITIFVFSNLPFRISMWISIHFITSLLVNSIPAHLPVQLPKKALTISLLNMLFILAVSLSSVKSQQIPFLNLLYRPLQTIQNSSWNFFFIIWYSILQFYEFDFWA